MKNKCNFCGSEYTKKEIETFERILFKSAVENDIKICDECLNNCLAVLKDVKKDLSSTEDDLTDEILTPEIIKSRLDEWIIDQEKAKYKVAVALHNHYKRLKSLNNKKSDIQIQKSNIMLVGPTGSGKTEIVRSLAKQLNVPYTIEDVTSITSAGYVGRDTDAILKNLITAAGGDIEKAQKGIVFLDEGDKLRRKGNAVSGQKDVTGEGVQQSLLKMVEGGVIDVKIDKTGQNTMRFDTTNVLFIIGGAFEGIEEIISERIKKKNNKVSIGIGAKIDSKEKPNFNEYINEIKPEDLQNFGMTPELLGRFPVIAPLHELTEEALISILIEPKNAIIKQYKELFAMDGIELEFEEDALKAIAKKAKERKIGARALRSVLEDVLEEPMFKAPSNKDITKVTITKDLTAKYAETVQATLEI